LFSRWRGQKKRKNLFSFFLSSNLPNRITHLNFGWDFNQPVNNLPNSTRQGEALTVGRACALITHLAFGRNFNQSLNNLPKNVKKVRLHTKYKRNRKRRILNFVQSSSIPTEGN